MSLHAAIDEIPDFPGTAPTPLEPDPDQAASDGAQVVVRLLAGGILRGRLGHEEALDLHGNLLPLHVGASELMVPLGDIRSVEAQTLLNLPRPSASSPTLASHSLEQFELHFSDGVRWSGTTLGHRVRHRGLQLHVQLPDGHFKPVWVPRCALRGVRFHALPSSMAEQGVRASAARQAQQPVAAAPPSDPVPAPAPSFSTPVVDPPAWPPVRTPQALAEALETGRRLPLRSIEQVLLDLHLLEQGQLDNVRRDMPDALHGHGELLVRAGLLTQDQLAHVHARMVWTPEVDVVEFAVEPLVLERASPKQLAAHEVFPLMRHGDAVVLACATPLDQGLERQLRVLLNCPVILVWAPRAQIMQRLWAHLHPTAAQPRAAGTAAPAAAPADIYSLLDAALNEFKVQSAEQHDVAVDESSSLVRLVTRIILEAYAQRASDIHIESNPGDEYLRIRFRKDGELEDYLRMPAVLRPSLISRIKVMARLDIAEKRRPQDGKINFHDYAPLPLELRVAVLPTHDGLEDVVMRLLASGKPMPLKSLGLREEDEAQIGRMAQRSFGLLLACGPTGSGKTTTLHSILAHINTDNRKIWTAEDPIEITQPGLRQLHVNPKIGVTFASAMRAFLRADPDVIMIGEIRDEETASIAIEASLTGHLVLSTLHTNSAAESVVRLLDMGMDPMNFADSLVGIVAQRLVRALCPRCAEAQVMDGQALENLVQEYTAASELSREAGWARLLQAAGVATPDQLRVWAPRGCEHCRNTGYKGRMGVYEILENSASIKRLIQTRASASEILAEAQRQGMRTLRQDALEKVVRGRIDLAQARTAYL